jgi:RNA polymerase sigma-70 factor (ECF subfamily)
MRANGRTMASDSNWLDVLARLLEGDRLAFLELGRLVTAFLVRLRVYDLRDEWEDLRQEVVLAMVAAARAGRLREPGAIVGFVRAVTRNKVADRLGARYRAHEMQAQPWQDLADELVDTSGRDAEDAVRAAALWDAVEALPSEQRAAVRGVYLEGKTYEAVSAETGIPLGTMKRRLRDALVALRARFAAGDEREPKPALAETTSKGASRRAMS